MGIFTAIFTQAMQELKDTKLEECVSYLIVSRKSTKENFWCKEHDLIKKSLKYIPLFSVVWKQWNTSNL